MTTHVLIMFCLITLTQTISIGPSVSLLLANYFNSGFKHSLPVSLAFRCGEAITLLLAFLITTVLHLSPLVFSIIKIAGGGYLAYLGGKGIIAFVLNRCKTGSSKKETVGFLSALLVPVINPKALIYFTSFIPSFIVSKTPEDYSWQFLILGLAFLCVSLFSDMCFLALASGAKKVLGGNVFRYVTLASSIFLLITGVVFVIKGIY